MARDEINVRASNDGTKEADIIDQLNQLTIDWFNKRLRLLLLPIINHFIFSADTICGYQRVFYLFVASQLAISIIIRNHQEFKI